jgi:hypothetical protein
MECRNDPHPHEKSSLMGGASRSDHVWFPPDTSNRGVLGLAPEHVGAGLADLSFSDGVRQRLEDRPANDFDQEIWNDGYRGYEEHAQPEDGSGEQH